MALARGRLILVKHGRPEIEPNLPRSVWWLSEAGREQAGRLAERLAAYAPDALFSSREPKASQTAEVLGARLGLANVVEPGFGEHRADEDPFDSQAGFEAKVARLFARPDEPAMGEETGAAARARFAEALARRGLPGGRTAVVVSHGRIITLWLAPRLGLEPMRFWTRLKPGCAVVVGAEGHELIVP
ncbi:MAG: histidine phosphatase family protein [Proteobacteria bacterium]|nr:histidine phosphatase family protein [Pseudomonadota bacterium]